LRISADDNARDEGEGRICAHHGQRFFDGVFHPKEQSTLERTADDDRRDTYIYIYIYKQR
jgi:hypothetical protein